MLCNSVKEINRLRKEVNRLLSKGMFLIREVNRLRKEIKRLLSKGMSNIYLKVILRLSQNFDFLGLKKRCKTSCYNVKIIGLGAKLGVAFLFSISILILKGIMIF